MTGNVIALESQQVTCIVKYETRSKSRDDGQPKRVMKPFLMDWAEFSMAIRIKTTNVQNVQNGRTAEHA